MPDPVEQPPPPTGPPTPASPPAATIQPTQWVSAITPQGDTVKIPAEQIKAAAAAGYSVLGERREPERSLGSELYESGMAFGLAGRKALTIGLSPIIEKKLTGILGETLGYDREKVEAAQTQYVNRLQEEHPIASGVGGVAGLVGGTVLTAGVGGALGAAARGGSALARAGQVATAATPLGLVELGGGLAESAVARGLGSLASQGALARAGLAASKFAARGAAEAGIYSGIEEMNEEALGPSDLNAEKILLAAGHGAAVGGIFGAALGGGGSLVKSGAAGAVNLVKNAIPEVVSDVVSAKIESAKSIVNAVKAGDATAIDELAAEQRWRALDPLKKYTQKAMAIEGGIKGVSDTLKEYGVIGRDLKDAAVSGDVETIATRAEAAKQQVGERLGELHAGSKASVKWGDVSDAYDSIIKPLETEHGREAVVSSLKQMKQSLAKSFGIDEELAAQHALASAGKSEAMRASELLAREPVDSVRNRLAAFLEPKIGRAAAEETSKVAFDGSKAVAALDVGGKKFGRDFVNESFELAKQQVRSVGKTAIRDVEIPIQEAIRQRQVLDDIAYQEAKQLNPQGRVKFLREIRTEFEGKIVKAFDESAAAAGNPELSQNLRKLKKDYQRLSLASDAAEDSTSRMATNRNISLSDYMSGGIAANMGGALLGPLGHVAGGALGASLNRYGRQYGNAIAAAALDKAAQFTRARAAAALADKQIAAAAKGIVTPKELKAASAKVTPYRGEKAAASASASSGGANAPLKKRFDRAMTELERIRANGESVLNHVSAGLSHMPQTSSAVTLRSMRTLEYLTSIIPRPAQQPSFGAPNPTRVSEPDMHRFVEAYHVAVDPSSALKKMALGRFTIQESRTLREVSPGVFAQLQREALSTVADHQRAGRPLPFVARQRLNLLLGVPTDPSQTPKMAMALQNAIAQTTAAQAQKEMAQASRTANLKLSDQTSKLDKMENS